jgi:hypothetical protein
MATACIEVGAVKVIVELPAVLLAMMCMLRQSEKEQRKSLKQTKP